MTLVSIGDDAVRFGESLSISFQRTLRVPEDGREYPPPPPLGRLPVCRVADYAEKVPPSWRAHGGVFIPMYQREALWLSFGGLSERPRAVKVAAGMVNAVSGKPWSDGLDRVHQDYLVCPDQRSLHGVNVGSGTLRQFIAMPLGSGTTIEAQVTGYEVFGGIQITVHGSDFGLATTGGVPDARSPDTGSVLQEPYALPQSYAPHAPTPRPRAATVRAPAGAKRKARRGPLRAVGNALSGIVDAVRRPHAPMQRQRSTDLPGYGPDETKPAISRELRPGARGTPSAAEPPGAAPVEMGLAAGGRVSQRIAKDRFEGAWDTGIVGRLYVHIVNSEAFREITGMDPPPTPISVKTYAELGVPWFTHYQDNTADGGEASGMVVAGRT